MVEEAVKAFNNASMSGIHKYDHDALIAAIEAALQAAWISVEDRLPEKETPVIVRTTWDEVGIDALRNVGDVYWWRDKDNQNITHWMFLPKYKGE
jgi:hypothetical protein